MCQTNGRWSRANYQALSFAIMLIVVLPIPLLQGAEQAQNADKPLTTPPPLDGATITNTADKNPTTDVASVAQSAEPIFTDSEWQKQQASPATAPTAGAVVGQAAMGLIVSLVVIAGLAVALAWASKRFGMRRVIPGRGQHVQVIETVPLGFKRAISLVRIHDQLLVIGQGEHELCHLATMSVNVLTSAESTSTTTSINTSVTPAPLNDTSGGEPPPPSSAPSSAFSQLLEKMGGRRS
jgi:flagellar biosynthetic protein FliO